MKNLHSIWTWIAIIIFLIWLLFENFWVENKGMLFGIYIVAIIFLFIEPIYEMLTYFNKKLNNSNN